MQRRPTNICRAYVASLISGGISKCTKGKRCRFNHPEALTEMVIQDYEREPGYCYCGASLQTLQNKRVLPIIPSDDEVIDLIPYFVVCCRTGKRITLCRGKKPKHYVPDNDNPIVIGTIE